MTRPLVRFFDVALPIALPLSADKLFTYSSSLDLQPGDYVGVPVRNSILCGVVWREREKAGRDVKEVVKKLAMPPMSASMRSFMQDFADYNMCGLGSVLKSLPKEMAKIDVSKPVKPTISNSVDHSQLNKEQLVALDTILNNLGKFGAILLDGVTGSGKTAVYMEAIKSLKDDEQALVLLPEILLVSQLRSMSQATFGQDVILWHSSSRARAVALQNIITGHARVTIGARSALMLPYKNLKLIVIDEEHDSGYKQESSICYNARDMAVLRARAENIPIILSSATPSLETIHNAKTGKYSTAVLSQVFSSTIRPCVEVVDMKKENNLISSIMMQAISDELQKQHQVMLFLNRRGYSNLTICTNCGHKLECRNCSTWLVEHRHAGKYRCHYCQYQQPITHNCVACKKSDCMKRYGTGVERVHEEVRTFFPGADIALMSSDTMRSTRVATETIEKILSGKVNIIIGTQLIAKGHNFPNLTLVCVVDVDSGGSWMDFRSGERTYQALRQVSGRVGRYQLPGKILLQTHTPDSTLIHALRDFDRAKFYDYELCEREKNLMPPFARLCCITFSGKSKDSTEQAARDLASRLCLTFLKVMGPSPSPVSYINRMHRWQIIVKILKGNRSPLREAIADMRLPSGVRVKIDIDPLSFM